MHVHSDGFLCNGLGGDLDNLATEIAISVGY
jgi:hypothetical protein